MAEITHPFAGYYAWNEGPETAKPRSLFIFTKVNYTWEKILRARQKINQDLGVDIAASLAQLKIANKIHAAIRIKGIQNFNDIKIIQQRFKDRGFAFTKAFKIATDEPIQIKLNKFFNVQALADDIYKDLRQQNMSYIRVPYQAEGALYKTISAKIKNNISDRIYDVVQACFYKSSTVQDMLRIYKPNATLALLTEIKDAYHRHFSKYRHP